MNYALAKKLKDAGFQHLHGAGCYEFETDTCLPTLSELIEACGNKFSKLALIGPDKWYAEATIAHHGYADAIERTPEEAVARLWLALHKI